MLRYQRQTILAEVGTHGQAALATARVLVVGAGGLANAALLYLCAAGVGQKASGGYITIVDDDTIDTSNLQRQILFREAEKGTAKVEAAQRQLAQLNHTVDVRIYQQRLYANNAAALMAAHNIIVDGSDNATTKYLLNDTAAALNKPLVYGSALGWCGQVAIFHPPHTACLRCVYPHLPLASDGCSVEGIMGAVCGVVGSMQALEVCKWLLQQAQHSTTAAIEPLLGRLWFYDGLQGTSRLVAIKPAATCSLHSSGVDT